MNTGTPRPTLSIVIPSYNSAAWIPSTLNSLREALAGSDFDAEVILVNDGSTDDTEKVVQHIAGSFPVTLRLVSQKNGGVFSARKRGAMEACFEHLLFLDSRVLIDSAALVHLRQMLQAGDRFETRIGHVETDRSVPLVGRFWEVPTHVFWGSYLRKPALTRLTPQNFDSVPKGTGFLLCNKQLFLEACDYVGNEADRFVSDDTKLLRYIVKQHEMLLDPDFRATYRPRTNVRKFLSHGYLRGTLFVDSYYGTSTVRNAVLWLVSLSIPAAVVLLITALLTGAWAMLAAVVASFLLLVFGLVGVSAVNRAPVRAISAFLVYVLPFTGVFWAGVTRGLLLQVKGKH